VLSDEIVDTSTRRRSRNAEAATDIPENSYAAPTAFAQEMALIHSKSDWIEA
jgi:hypothetical protein